MGSPQEPTPEQYKTLEAAGQLQKLGDDSTTAIADHTAKLEFSLPRKGVSLLVLTW
jgi:xylan 1,4-beta-xylosidase